MKKLTLFIFVFSLFIYSQKALAFDSEELNNCICGGKYEQEAANACLNKTKEEYFKENKYSQLVDLLKSLCPEGEAVPLLSYNIALSRFEQLKYLEESKSWDEYFAKGNDYRDEIVKESAKATVSLPKYSPEFLSTQLLLYKFHKGQQDAFAEGALSDLMASADEYSESGNDLALLKEVADTLLSYDEKSKSKEVYKLYARALIKSDIKDEGLRELASQFYQEGNLELSQNIYNAYMGRINNSASKEDILRELKFIAEAFSYKDSGFYDLNYAENIFQKIEDLGGIDAFNEDLIYMRGFNLEKNKSFEKAKNIYSLLLKKYPKSRYAEELIFKSGIISTYVLRDSKEGLEYFKSLADKKETTPYSLGSLYQLGLIKQWEGDLSAAKNYYSKLIDKSKADKEADVVLASQKRLKEIENKGPIEHNLKSFMDAALKKEFSGLDMSKIDLKSDIYNPKPKDDISMNAHVYLAASGCFNIEVQYLWSGDLGGMSPGVKDSGFKASYNNRGVKIIGLVLISPTGITDYAFDLIDVR